MLLHDMHRLNFTFIIFAAAAAAAAATNYIFAINNLQRYICFTYNMFVIDA
jgi:hypothetical protein